MTRAELDRWQPRHRFFIGVDSDGCAFDSMNRKHRDAFIPAAIAVWRLEPVAAAFAEAEEQINLRSRHRGINRFAGLLLSFRRLQEMVDVRAHGATLPDLDELAAFVASGLPQSNDGLRTFLAHRPSATGDSVLSWSLLADARFRRGGDDEAPFPGVKEALAHAATRADLMIVSAAPAESLERDWTGAGLMPQVSLIGGQEAGSKAQQIRAATAGRYEAGQILILGDAPGDLEAARAVGARFYPIIPGDETASWRRFREEILGAFVLDRYVEALEDAAIAAFTGRLGLPTEKPADAAGAAPVVRINRAL